MSAQEEPRVKLIKQMKLMLGDQMVDLEADPEHYDTAVDLAIERYRQRSDGATEEANLFLSLQPEQDEYTLPSEVLNIHRLYKRGVGSSAGGGSNFDPFEAAFSNMYLLQAGRTGGLATWDFFAQYQESIGRVFGSEINFTFNTATKKLKIIRKVKAEEDVLIRAHIIQPEHVLLIDPYAKPWLREYALAELKIMIGEARSKFSSGLPGPNGNVILNGEALKQEGMADKERLEQEIQNFVAADNGMPFVIG
jgi:hypothetical protein